MTSAASLVVGCVDEIDWRNQGSLRQRSPIPDVVVRKNLL